MNIRKLWSGLGLAAAPEWPATPDKLILTQAAQVCQVMCDLVQSSRTLLVHSLDSNLPTSARLRGLSATDVTLTFDGDQRKRALLEGTDLSLTASTRAGSVFFTLNKVQETARGCWRSALPKEVIRVQSREYFRVTCVGGPRHMASLKLPGAASALLLDNLSETGLGLRVACPVLQPCETVADSTLQLDGNSISLPALRIIFNATSGATHWRIGAAIDGLSQGDARTIRRWIHSVETASLR